MPSHVRQIRSAMKRLKTKMRLFFCVTTLISALWPAVATFAQTPEAPVGVRILAINDFHGNLEPPPGGIRVADPADPSKAVNVEAGGAEHLATLVKELRAKNKNNVFVAAGDLIGASPFLSAMFHDEPTVNSLSMMGLAIASVGNHEFDEGKDELLRMQNGGCHPVDGCKGPAPFAGAKYKYLAASTIDTQTGKPLLPPYEIREFEGIPMAFIGLTLKATPTMVSPSGVVGLEFKDEAETVNALVPEIRARGVEAIAVLIHEGGWPSGDYNDCPGISGPIVDIVKKLDKAVDLIVSGHTHRAYNCAIDGRLVTSGDKYGTVVTAIDVQLDRKTRDVVSAKANNNLVRVSAYAKDPEQTALIATYQKLAKPLGERVVGAVTADLSRNPNEAGETPLGNIIADAQLAATREGENGAVVAFTNPGGVRTSLTRPADGKVTFADVFATQPFRNRLVTMTLTGAQIKQALEQQWATPARPRILHVSSGFSYDWTASGGDGTRVPAASIMLNGGLLDPDSRYRVTVNEFLADGGDAFSVFTKGTDRIYSIYDVDALASYFAGDSPISPKPLDRIRRID